jgi:hypothetical protein
MEGITNFKNGLNFILIIQAPDKAGRRRTTRGGY